MDTSTAFLRQIQSMEAELDPSARIMENVSCIPFVEEEALKDVERKGKPANCAVVLTLFAHGEDGLHPYIRKVVLQPSSPRRYWTMRSRVRASSHRKCTEAITTPPRRATCNVERAREGKGE